MLRLSQFALLALIGLAVLCCAETNDNDDLSATIGPSVYGVGSEGESGEDATLGFNSGGVPNTPEDAGTGEPTEDIEEPDAPSLEDVGPPVPTEEVDCSDGIDNDEDGKTDCKDSDCAALPICVETACDDGEDNDGDGDTDCYDFNCWEHPACEVETCQSFYLCIAEEGCNCTVGTTCPEAGTPEFEACQSTCINDESGSCPETCVDQLPPHLQINLASFQTCTKASCAAAPTDEAYYDCVLSDCLTEYAACFYGGVLDCGEFYYECASDCDGDAVCINVCKDALSADGYVDAVKWDQCRNDLCDLDLDGELDSDACYYMGSFFACSDSAGSCIPGHLMEDTGTCLTVTDCLLSCSTFDESSCVLDCLQWVGASNQLAVSNMIGCMVAECGSTSLALTPICAANALANSCQNEWATCSMSAQ